MSKKQAQGLPLSISQNFLTSKRTIERLVRPACLTKHDTVLEIGAGKGHITRCLAQYSGSVIAYELDPALAARLKGRLPENVRLYCADFLTAPLPRTPYKVFANIPFSRTTEILRKLTAAPRAAQNPPGGLWLLVEKGAAKRFCGLPRPSRSSLLLRPFWEAKIVDYLRREDFHPAPRVDTVLLQLICKSQPDLPYSQYNAYHKFITHCLRYGPYGPRALLTKRQAATALRLAGLPPLPASGDMLYIQWLCLFRAWLQYGSKNY